MIDYVLISDLVGASGVSQRSKASLSGRNFVFGNQRVKNLNLFVATDAIIFRGQNIESDNRAEGEREIESHRSRHTA